MSDPSGVPHAGIGAEHPQEQMARLTQSAAPPRHGNAKPADDDSAAAPPSSSASFSRLAAVELQLIMHFCDKSTLLALARCCRSALTAASHPFAWRSLSPLQFHCCNPGDLAAQLSPSSLLRFVDLAVEWELQSALASAALDQSDQSTAAASLPRLRSLAVRSDLSAGMDDSAVAALAAALQQHGHALHTFLLDTRIGPAGAVALAEFIRQSGSLTSVDLSVRYGTPLPSLVAVATAAAGSSSLRVIRLRGDMRMGGLRAFAAALTPASCLTELVLRDCGVGDVELADLAPRLREVGGLCRLTLVDNPLGDPGAAVLVAALGHWRGLGDLRVADCDIGDAGGHEIVEALRRCPNLRALDLSANSALGFATAHALAGLLAVDGCRLTSLDLSACGLQDEGATELAESLRANRSLTELRLARCSVESRGAAALGTALQHSEDTGSRSVLRTLVLSLNKIGVPGAAALAESLLSGLALEHLDLSHCSIGDGEMSALATGLPHCRSLHHLSLGHNRFSQMGTTSLAAGLTGHASLAELSLTATVMSEAMMAALLPALLSCTSLRVLDLSRCHLSASSGPLLARLLQSRSLSSLRVQRNDLGADGACALAAALHSTSALRRLHLDSDGAGFHGLAALAQAVARGWSPVHLDLSNAMSPRRVGDEGPQVLAAAIAQRARSLPIESLSLARCALSESAVLAWLGAGACIPALRRIDLSHNLPAVSEALLAAARDFRRRRPHIELRL